MKKQNQNKVPTKALRFIVGLLSCGVYKNCSALARLLNCCHDNLTKVLAMKRICWIAVIRGHIARTFGKLSNGYLVLDDTVVDKNFSRKIAGCSWIYDSKIGHAVMGLNLVVLVWTNESITIPIGIKLYKKDSGKTKIDLAVELIEYAKNTLNIKPLYVLFDSYYSAHAVLEVIESFDWRYVTQVKKNRKLNNQSVFLQHKQTPYWTLSGTLSHGHKVIICRHRKNYYTTNDLTLSGKNIRVMYLKRWCIEEFFRVIKTDLGLNECQASSEGTQWNHINLVVLAYFAILSEKTRTEETCYAIKHRCIKSTEFSYELVNACFRGGA
jgi:hypothetical protein